MGNILNICYITDNKYFLPTLVSIISIAENCSNSSINIHVICSDISQKYIKILDSLSFRNISIIVNFVENPYKNLGEKHRHVSKTALLKFSVPYLFPNLDKILYLDSDILVFRDLENLYDIDLNNSYVAAVSDIKAVKCYHFDKKLGLDNYFNSGVMLLNLEKMRNDNISEKLVELKNSEKEQSFMDQNALK
ncbi:glycosyltransferase family 8 protein [bacterium]|nr:glycosyltransferase family 8 protein [bacterium]